MQKPQRVKLTLLDGASCRWPLRGPADLVLIPLNQLSKLVGDAFSLHEENLAPQSSNVLLSISSNWPRHRETKSNYEFRPPHDLSLLLLDSPIPRWRAPRWDRLTPRYKPEEFPRATVHEQKAREATTLARHFLMLQTGLSAKLFF